MRMQLTRDFYVPKNATKVIDKKSDAVAYIYTSRRGYPAAAVFFGKQSKPIVDAYYASPAAREERVAQLFKNRQEVLAYKAERSAKRTGWVNTYEVGDIFHSSWGYDQTNNNFYEVISSKGKTLIVREIAQTREYTNSMAGQTKPVPGRFLGNAKEITCRAQEHGIKVDHDQHASLYVKRNEDGTYPEIRSSYFSEYA